MSDTDPTRLDAKIAYERDRLVQQLAGLARAALDDPARERRVPQQHDVGLEDACFLGADPLSQIRMDAAQTRFGFVQRRGESGELRRDGGLVDLSSRNGQRARVLENVRGALGDSA